MKMRRIGLRSSLAAAAAVVTMAGGITLAAAGPASAAYGKGQVYQIELSANISGPDGGGVWLWFGLNSNGTGDYQGSDCGHGLGAAHDGGDVTWNRVGNEIVISPVVLNGLEGFSAVVTVPADYGHYTGAIGTFITLPPFIPPAAGNSQLQVAP